MEARRNAAVSHLESKIAWLRSQWGDFTALTAPADEPMRDTTPAATLPEYARPAGIENITVDTDHTEPVYFNLQGIRVPAANMTPGVYVKVAGKTTTKVVIK